MTDQNLTLEVDYKGGTPVQIEYFHNTFGMMRFEVKDSTAILSDKWNRLKDGKLKDGFTRWVTTGDVLRNVEQLPFISEIRVSND